MAQTLGVERQPLLQALKGVEQKRAEEAEGEESAGVARPVLFLFFVDAAEAVDEALDWAERRGQEIPAAFDHGRDEGAERLRADQDQEEKYRDL